MFVKEFGIFKPPPVSHRIQCLTVNEIVYGIQYTWSRELVVGDDRRGTAARPIMVGGRRFFLRLVHFSTSELASIFRVIILFLRVYIFCSLRLLFWLSSDLDSDLLCQPWNPRQISHRFSNG